MDISDNTNMYKNKWKNTFKKAFVKNLYKENNFLHSFFQVCVTRVYINQYAERIYFLFKEMDDRVKLFVF